MRLVLKLGWQHDDLGTIAAAGESSRLFTASFDVKTVCGVVALAVTLLGMHTSTVSQLAAMQRDQVNDHQAIAANGDRITRVNQRVSAETVSRADFDRHVTQVDHQIAVLTTGEMQIYSDLLGRGCPAAAPTRAHTPIFLP